MCLCVRCGHPIDDGTPDDLCEECETVMDEFFARQGDKNWVDEFFKTAIRIDFHPRTDKLSPVMEGV